MSGLQPSEFRLAFHRYHSITDALLKGGKMLQLVWIRDDVDG
jgi:hypothetical protein